MYEKRHAMERHIGDHTVMWLIHVTCRRACAHVRVSGWAGEACDNTTLDSNNAPQ